MSNYLWNQSGTPCDDCNQIAKYANSFMIIIVHMNYIIEGHGALVNEAGEETPLKAGDFTLVNPSEKHQYCNKGEIL